MAFLVVTLFPIHAIVDLCPFSGWLLKSDYVLQWDCEYIQIANCGSPNIFHYIFPSTLNRFPAIVFIKLSAR